MSIVLHILNVSKTLDSYMETIQRAFDESVTEITKVIPIDVVDVVVVDNKRGAIPEIGFGGHAYGPHFVGLSVDIGRGDSKKLIEEELPGFLAHELHHCKRWQHVEYGTTLREALITEGLAAHFEEEISGKTRPWTVALKDAEIEKYLELARKEFGSTDYSHQAWFFGSKTEGIPRWTGYSLGYYMVGEYLKKNPGKKASDLYKLPASEFGF